MCSGCGNKKSKFIKEQEVSRLLSQLGIRTPLNKCKCKFSKRITMNNIINKILVGAHA